MAPETSNPATTKDVPQNQAYTAAATTHNPVPEQDSDSQEADNEAQQKEAGTNGYNAFVYYQYEETTGWFQQPRRDGKTTHSTDVITLTLELHAPCIYNPVPCT